MAVSDNATDVSHLVGQDQRHVRHAASTRRVTWWKGLVVGFGLWVIMMVFYLPIGGDVFRLATSRAVWMSSLLGHLIYGVSVGLLAGRHQPELIEEPV